MPLGIQDYKFLILATFEATGFEVAVPLVMNETVSIAHAMVDKYFLIIGPKTLCFVGKSQKSCIIFLMLSKFM